MKEKRTGEIVAGIIGNILAIVIVNSVLLWRQWTHGVVLESWVDILWAANLSLLVQIAGNLILVFYRPPRVYWLSQALFAAVGLVSLIVFYIVFPLDFSQLVGIWLNTLLKIILIIGMIGTLIGFVVQLVRFILGKPYAETTNK
jgi:hypothetical protein